jgi:hypothetical protein
MNPFCLGKLAEFHIQRLVDEANEGRTARRARSQYRSLRPKHHFHWRHESVNKAPSRAVQK